MLAVDGECFVVYRACGGCQAGLSHCSMAPCQGLSLLPSFVVEALGIKCDATPLPGACIPFLKGGDC